MAVEWEYVPSGDGKKKYSFA